MKRFGMLVLSVVAIAAVAIYGGMRTSAQAAYTPQAVFCSQTGLNGSLPLDLCSVIPGNIGPDPALNSGLGYQGIVGNRPTSAATDVETPFDNLSWQTFVALNWTAGKEKAPPIEGLKSDGRRVWETWATMAKVYGNSPVLAHCLRVPVSSRTFAIGSDGKGNPDAHNEEYIEAATGEPAIDVGGNWALYERRLNDVEIGYLKAPGGNTQYNLATYSGQQAFAVAGQTVNFPAVSTTAGTGPANGAIEIKAAWRILDPKQHAQNAKKFYIVKAYVTVPKDLVAGGQQVCAPVELGLVAMHIIQKNPVTTNKLLPQWFWSTFEQVDNAPLAAQACDPATPSNCKLLNKVPCPPQGPQPQNYYSFYDPNCINCTTNQAPAAASSGAQFAWNSAQPYAKGYLTNAKYGTQIARCWKNYYLTDNLNRQWQAKLASVNSVFRNYMLIGTQWGANVEPITPPPSLPANAVPLFLSNTIIETYIQMGYVPGTSPPSVFQDGSCVSCHSAATLAYQPKNPVVAPISLTANFSFAMGLAQPLEKLRPPLGAPGHATMIRQ